MFDINPHLHHNSYLCNIDKKKRVGSSYSPLTLIVFVIEIGSIYRWSLSMALPGELFACDNILLKVWDSIWSTFYALLTHKHFPRTRMKWANCFCPCLLVMRSFFVFRHVGKLFFVHYIVSSFHQMQFSSRNYYNFSCERITLWFVGSLV